MKRLFHYLNPMAHLGDRRSSPAFSFFTMLAVYILSEVYVYGIAKDPMAVGAYVIFLSVALIIYFAFRQGIWGGLVATIITLLYYVYIIQTRHYTGKNLTAGLDTTAVLGVLFALIAIIIGWLKQTIDTLIVREADERRRLQAIVQQLPVGVLITDNNGRVIQTNRQLDLIMGLRMPQGFVVGRDTIEHARINGKIINPSQAPLIHALMTGKPMVGKDFTYDRPDGKKRYLQISAAPIHNRDGKLIAAASIISDVTIQKEMEARKDDFVNMASHELKTPITSMKLYTDTLQKQLGTDINERTKKIVSRIKNQTERLQELVNDLLDVSRLQTGKLGFSKETFALDALIAETVDGLQATTKRQPIKFSPKESIRVHADRFRIYQVLTNLLTNAVKYSPENTDIVVRVKRSGGNAVVSIQDLGIGIAKDQQKKIFDRLYQVADSTEKTFPGFGMGLYISKEIIKRHKGHIWVESEKGKGATFSFSLPLVKK